MCSDDVEWLSPGDQQLIARELSEQFREVFGREAAGVWFAPGRANLNGEHIDFHGGRCLPMALAHGTYVAAAPREDGTLRLRTLNEQLDDGVKTVVMCEIGPKQETPPAGASEHANDSAHSDKSAHSDDSETEWTRYVSGTLWALRLLGAEEPEFAVDEDFGADLLITSTLPIGGGLSSSAALECSSMLAFVAMGTEFGRNYPGDALNDALGDEQRARLAAACMRAEVEVVDAGTGGLDQTTSLRGREGHLVALDCRDFTVERLLMAPLLEEYTFLAVDTGQAHWLGDGQFGDRRKDAEAAMRLLGHTRLRDALPENPDGDDVAELLSVFDQRVKQAREAGPEAETGSTEPVLSGRDTQACRRRLRHALSEMVRSERLRALLLKVAPETVAATAGSGVGSETGAEAVNTASASASSAHLSAAGSPPDEGPGSLNRDATPEGTNELAPESGADLAGVATQIGEIMTEGHESMRDDAEVSFERADEVVDVALMNGAEGARLIGGGFGGSVLVLARKEALCDLTPALAEVSKGIRLVEVTPSSPARAL